MVSDQQASSILNRDPNVCFEERFDQWYLLITDMIDTWLYKPPKVKETKFPKYITKVLYSNRGMPHIKPAKILRETYLIEKLSECLCVDGNDPLISYKLTSPIRNQIFNYKETV